MIKSKEGIVEVEGSKEVVLADFLTLVMGTYKSLKEKMPEEKAAQSLIKYTQKGMQSQDTNRPDYHLPSYHTTLSTSDSKTSYL